MESGVKHARLEQICIQALKAQQDPSQTYRTQDLEQQQEQPSSSRTVCPKHQSEVILRIECITERQMKVDDGTLLNRINAHPEESHMSGLFVHTSKPCV